MLPNVKKHTLRHTKLLKMPLFSRKESILNGNNHRKQEGWQCSIIYSEYSLTFSHFGTHWPDVVYVPAASVEAYKASETWAYVTSIEAIS